VYYLYYDPDVSGIGESETQWVIGFKPPSTTALSNLADESNPLVLGRGGAVGSAIVAHTAETKYSRRGVTAKKRATPPSLVEWEMICSAGAGDVFGKPMKSRLGINDRETTRQHQRWVDDVDG
jgi:hypothetical protein